MKIHLDDLTSRVPCDHDFIRYDPGACSGCGACAVLCAANLWTMEEGIAHLRQDYRDRCLECGACFQGCPTGAIDFRYPADGAGVVYLRG